MKKIIGIFLSIFLGVTGSVYTQDSSVTGYFPLQAGNVWVYSGYTYMLPQCSITYYQRLYIDSIKIFNNKLYYKFNLVNRFTGGNGNCAFFIFGNNYYRLDSMSGELFRYDSNADCILNPHEIFVDSLRSKPGDTSYVCGRTVSEKKICRDTLISVVFGNQKRTKNFEGGNFHEYSFLSRYAKDIGLIECSQGGMSLSSQSVLKGCVINGVVYGDTSYYLVGFEQVSEITPVRFELSQNYPNPFNPVTEISFDIPKSTLVSLTVYDALGREVETLLNEVVNAGTYKYNWDASSYPSGVYLYRLTAGDFSITKKMTLIK